MHGGHVIITAGFKSVHISHVELTKMGQPQLGRYPLHWHLASDVGPDGYEDPSSFEYNSIHNAFNRWITVHGTNNARVIGNVGYHTRGHGYFIEDGNEKGTIFDGNLGMVAHQGIVLPTDKGSTLCRDAKEGWQGHVSTSACQATSIFWISNIYTYIDNNFAVGGNACYWILPHNSQFWASSRDHPPGPWTNNRGSSCNQGLFVESVVEDRLPEESRPIAQFGRFGGRQAATYDGNALNGCYPVTFDGWKIHHTRTHGAWIRQGTVIFKNSQFSDCPRCFTYPTADCPDQYHIISDTVFQGFTENIGNPEYDFITNTGMIEIHQNGQFTNGGVNMYVRWHKGPDGVYRTDAQHKLFPTRGINVYDTFVPTYHFNLKFFDYPFSETKFNSAFGMHIANRFGMTADDALFYNNTFDNVGRKVYFGDVGPVSIRLSA